MSGEVDLQQAVEEFGKPDMDHRLGLIEGERAAVLAQYPLTDWPHLRVDLYALGTGGESFCRLMEFQTPYLGSIKGGSSAKHIIYRRRSDRSWYRAGSLAEFPIDEAWSRLRDQFVRAFEAVRTGEFDTLDQLTFLRHGQALTTKAISVYFPEALLPIFSAAHLRHYIRIFGDEPVHNGLSWQLGFQLKGLVTQHPVLSKWTFDEVAWFLYQAFDPRGATESIVKIAPGRGGEFWKECVQEGVMRVGWDAIDDDLGNYAGPDDLSDALAGAYPEKSGRWHKTTATKLLRYFRDLPAGSRVVANEGKSKVLAVGTVTDDGYRFDSSKSTYRHTLSVNWDTSYEQEFDEPVNSWVSTFAPVKPALWQKIQAKKLPVGQAQQELDPEIKKVIEGLHRKKQVVLYGPPGTGKTRLARLAAVAFAENRVVDTTFHPSYGYEDFVEGYKPQDGGSGLTLKLTDGIFLDVCEKARKDPGRNYVLVIDEINRADLARVLGELITYLERDKRGRSFVLPTSRKVFNVPPNVYIIGTMNTADRSVAHLDAAIRRRFEFQGVNTDYEVVAGEIGPLDLRTLLEALNSRVRTHLSPDFQIGHSYFLLNDKPLDNETDVHAVFFHEVVPLLEDSTINDQQLLGAILGKALNVPPDMSPEELVTLLSEEFQAEAGTDVAG
ncbi:AAA family ATPase [Lentzea sp. NPDC060358]|uniref:AAA family ATPase n=1 Tax=Lentzea sp. NPDC060358 TaxID=3347103 RepID=UPI003660A95D